MYRELLQSGIQVKIIGDSIAAGSGSSDDDRSGPVILTVNGRDYKEQQGKKCWASLFGAYVRGIYPASKVVNRSCSHLDSTALRSNIRQFVEEKDRLILLMIGANDRKQERGRECLEENVKYLLDYFNRKKKSVLLMSYPPSTAENESRPDRFFHMADVDRILEEAAVSRYIPFISHYKLLLRYYQEQQLTVEEMMMAGPGVRDGLRPPDLVHHLIFEQIVRIVEN